MPSFSAEWFCLADPADADASLYEVLFASDLLARLGPAQDVAPVLKRICYRIEDNEVRLAMRCLLWRWY